MKKMVWTRIFASIPSFVFAVFVDAARHVPTIMPANIC